MIVKREVNRVLEKPGIRAAARMSVENPHTCFCKKYHHPGQFH